MIRFIGRRYHKEGAEQLSKVRATHHDLRVGGVVENSLSIRGAQLRLEISDRRPLISLPPTPEGGRRGIPMENEREGVAGDEPNELP